MSDEPKQLVFDAWVEWDDGQVGKIAIQQSYGFGPPQYLLWHEADESYVRTYTDDGHVKYRFVGIPADSPSLVSRLEKQLTSLRLDTIDDGDPFNAGYREALEKALELLELERGE